VHLRAGQIEQEGAGRGSAQAADFCAEGTAEIDEAVAQAGERLRLGTVGPEYAGEPRALHLEAVPECQESQEPEALARAEAWQRAPTQADLGGPEQPDLQGGGAGITPGT